MCKILKNISSISTVKNKNPGENRGKIIALLFSLILIAIIYSQLDLPTLWQTIKSANMYYLFFSILLSGPITLLLALRFMLAIPKPMNLTYKETVKLTLVASAFNKFLPAKSGDLVKSFFVTNQGNTTTGVALSIIAYERFCDLFSVVLFCVIGMWLLPPIPIPPLVWLLLILLLIFTIVMITSRKSAIWLYEILHDYLHLGKFERLSRISQGWPELHTQLLGRRRIIILISIFIWFVSLIQMWLFTLVVSEQVPLFASFSIFSLALFASQMPFTFAGLGVRDAVLIILLSKYMSAESAAFIGVLSALRGILPALASLLVARPYLVIVSNEIKRVGRLWNK